MAEVDPLIFKILADSREARRDVASFQRQAGQGLNRVERDVLRLETQIRRSSGAIGSSLKGLAGTLAAGFSIRQIQQLADGFTRYQNSLKVTGLEGERLGAVQERLFSIAQKYGTELESVGSLYSRTAQSQDALGASSEDLINVSEAVSASLKILPADAGAVSGALTQLGQAFSSPRVQAEEFNSIVDVLTPLMQEAAKHIEGTGGTLAGLKQKLKDMKGEGVSNVELFRAIAASLGELQTKAAKADQTVGQSLTKLNNALGLYIGQTDDGLSATERMAGAIELLADNIDVVANSLAILSGLLVGRFVVGLAVTQGALAGTAGQMGAVGAASFALQARAAGAATSMEALTFAARGFAATGIGLAVTAAAVGLGYLAAQDARAEQAAQQLSASIAAQAAEFDTLVQRQRESDAATDNLDDGQRRAITSTAALTGEAHLLANAWGRVAAEAKSAAIEQAKAAREKALTNLQGAQTAFTIKYGEALQREGVGAPRRSDIGILPPGFDAKGRRERAAAAAVGSKEYSDLVQGTATLNALNQRVRELQEQSLSEFRPPEAPQSASSGGKKGGSRGSAPSGPSAGELKFRFDQEYDSISQQILSAQQGVATSAQERAALERKSVDLAEKMALDSLAADGDYREGQKELLAAQLRKLGDAERERIAFNELAQTEQENADLAQQRHDIEADKLRLQYDLAKTEEDRRKIALRILDAEDAYLRSKLEATIASQTALKADKDRAKLDLKALDDTRDARKDLTLRQHQSPLEAYVEQTGDTKTRVEQAMVAQLREVNDGITDALTEQLGIKNRFVRDLFSIFLDRAIFQPLAEALQSGGSIGGGGGILGAIGSVLGSFLGIPGRASGGYVAPNSIHRVNEHAGGVELLRMGPQGGQVIPLGSVNQRASSTAPQIKVISAPQFDLRRAVVTPQLYADMERIARANAAQAGEAAYRQAMRDVPSRMDNYQRDGT